MEKSVKYQDIVIYCNISNRLELVYRMQMQTKFTHVTRGDLTDGFYCLVT